MSATAVPTPVALMDAIRSLYALPDSPAFTPGMGDIAFAESLGFARGMTAVIDALGGRDAIAAVFAHVAVEQRLADARA